ncbi:dolichol-phosphate mannosyltransferase homolog [alpha proteobacterium U9-1i]|nr:dolichol-phosphate mannosyltransferase homolog [alpha proteobacterium U9-1i]
MSPELTIVAPTFNERGNVEAMVTRLDTVLEGIRWEIVFVDDDSSDGTIEALRTLARADPRVRALHRIGRRGLATAVVEGIQSSSAPYIAVMDSDLQHDEALLPTMLRRLRDGSADLVIGSRYADGGGVGDWSVKRARMSRLGSMAARIVAPTPLSDPLSGFFMITRSAFDSVVRKLSSQGFKILLDIVASGGGGLRVVELPYTFRVRAHGKSKLDSAVAWDYLALLVDKTIGRFIPGRFVLFVAVGTIGVGVHLGVLGFGANVLEASFLVSQSIATLAAMTFNFFLNNLLTYRDRRLRGWGLVGGLLSFYAVCSVGAVANVGIAIFLFGQHYSWWLAGIAGILVGAVWNYAASSVFTWRR